MQTLFTSSVLFVTLLFVDAVGAASAACTSNVQQVSQINLNCPEGSVIRDVLFAQYGFPAGSCATGLVRSACGSDWASQNETDRNVEWVVSNICQGVRSCDLSEHFQPTDAPEQVFGDPCKYQPGKTIAVQVQCGEPYPDPSFPPSKWTTSQKFSLANLNLTAAIITNLYSVVADIQFPWQAFESKMVGLGLDVSPTSENQTIPFRYAPLVTYENYFNCRLFGFTTAWFGLFARLSIPGFVSISFRGTMTSTEWTYNANIGGSPLPDDIRGPCQADPNIRVHKGFLALYMGMRKILIAAVFAERSAKQFILSGHSLGSAFATLAAFDLMCLGHKVHSVYTFASPRVGNPSFAQAYHQLLAKSVGADPRDLSALPHFRITNTVDLVPAIPPAAVTEAKYMHVGSSDYSYEYVPLDWSVLNLTSGAFESWAHNIDNYLSTATVMLASRV